MSKRITVQERKKQAIEVHGDRYDYSLWPNKVSNETKVDIGCPDHGVFTQRLANHIRHAAGCPKCANAIRNRNNKKSHNQALDEINERNKKLPPVHLKEGTQYTTAKTKYTWVCKDGHEWKASFGDVVITGHGCAKCAVERRKKTMFNVYGVEHPIQSVDIRKKIDATNLERHGVVNPRHKIWDDGVLEKVNDKNWLYEQHVTHKRPFRDIADELGIGHTVLGQYFAKHGIKPKRFFASGYELRLADFLTSLNISFNSNDKDVIKPFEVDFYLPDHKIAIEFNGIYWHSELQGKDKNYHLRKHSMCEANDIRLIHIFESEWVANVDLIESRLQSILEQNKKIYARKCEVVELTTQDKSNFFNKNHIQQDIASSYCCGLTYNDELVAAMSFGNSRYASDYEYELIRFANVSGTNVVGGASRLFKHFIRQFDPTSVISYSDLRWNTGKLYEVLGFSFSHKSSPNYFYFHRNDNLNLQSRVKFQKHKLEHQLDFFDPNLSEWENMKLNNYNRIWDCGNAVYVWSK